MARGGRKTTAPADAQVATRLLLEIPMLLFAWMIGGIVKRCRWAAAAVDGVDHSGWDTESEEETWESDEGRIVLLYCPRVSFLTLLISNSSNC
jgi:hypothetical protein